MKMSKTVFKLRSGRDFCVGQADGRTDRGKIICLSTVKVGDIIPTLNFFCCFFFFFFFVCVFLLLLFCCCRCCCCFYKKRDITHCLLGTNFSRRHFDFSLKQALTYHANCFLMKCPIFLRKKRRKIVLIFAAKSSQREVKVKDKTNII